MGIPRPVSRIMRCVALKNSFFGIFRTTFIASTETESTRSFLASSVSKFE